MACLQSADERTLDYMYAGYLTSLKMEVMNSEDFKMINVVRHWLNVLNNAKPFEKMARNCLVCLLSQQIRMTGRISEPFNDLQNIELDLNTLLNRLGLQSGDPSTYSPLYNSLISPMKNEQCKATETDFNISVNESVSHNSSIRTFMVSEKLEDIHNIVSDLKMSRKYLKAELSKLKASNKLLTEKVVEQEKLLQNSENCGTDEFIESFLETLSNLSSENLQNTDLKLFQKLFKGDNQKYQEYDEQFENILKQIFIGNIKLKKNSEHCCCANFNTSTGLSSISDLSRQIVNNSKANSKHGLVLHKKRRFRDILLDKYRQQKRKYQLQNKVIRFKFISLITRIFLRNKERNFEEFQGLITQLDTKYMNILNTCTIQLKQ